MNSNVDEGMTPEPFLDWSTVWPGATAYEKDGRSWVSEGPEGVRLSVQPGEQSGPVLVDDNPDEGANLGWANVLYDEGRYKVWYARTNSAKESFLHFAESSDGFKWEKPHLGLYESNGSRANNIVYPRAIPGVVFKDPGASEKERYKLVEKIGYSEYQGRIIRGDELKQTVEELKKQGLEAAEIYGKHIKLKGQVFGAVSPDGLRWTQIKEPLFEKFCDTQNVVFFDQQINKYVGYWRTWLGSRRSIARSETDDFRHWPLPDLVLGPGLQEPPADDYYTNAYTRYPGNPDIHLMFPGIYHRTKDTVDVHLAVSRDGFNWEWPERVPIIPLGPEGSGSSGAIYAMPGLFPLGKDRWGIFCRGSQSRHNEAYHGIFDGMSSQDYKCQFSWATWKRDRLVALDAAKEGRVTLTKRSCLQEKIVLNYETARNGWIKVELIEPRLWPPAHLNPIEGYSFEECEPLRGDSFSGEVRWNGSSDISSFKGREVAVRIRMCQAKLFSISM
jgi:hypothetical protein